MLLPEVGLLGHKNTVTGFLGECSGQGWGWRKRKPHKYKFGNCAECSLGCTMLLGTLRLAGAHGLQQGKIL